MIQIRLGRPRRINPDEDELKRSRLGDWPDLDEDEAWKIGRGDWPLDHRRAKEHHDVQVINRAGIVLARAALTDTHPKHDGKRHFLDGKLIKGHPSVGKPSSTPHPSPQNAVYYIEDND